MARFILAILMMAFASPVHADELTLQQQYENCFAEATVTTNFGLNYHLCVVKTQNGVYSVDMIDVPTKRLIKLPDAESPVQIVESHDSLLLVYTEKGVENSYVVNNDGTLTPYKE